MGDYTKPWLSLDQQVEKLADRGLTFESHDHAIAVLCSVGYYRLAGYLYPFRDSERYEGQDGRSSTRIRSGFRPGATLDDAVQLIDFDRRLRLLVMDGVERVEVALRTQVGYILGRRSPFAHLELDTFLPVFTEHQVDERTGWRTRPSRHAEWLARVAERRDGSDEAFVTHFRAKYDGQMPIWALTEILELGHLSRLYQGLNEDDALEIARAFAVPTKRLMASWLASLNYVRNVAAHHARLFNRKLQYAPARPRSGVIPVLDHLRDAEPRNAFGVYNALAVVAYLLAQFDPGTDWRPRIIELAQQFPSTEHVTLDALGGPRGWIDIDLWRRS